MGFKMSTLDFRNKNPSEVLNLFEQIVEETKASNESLDFTILTNDHEVQGDLLELIDREELEHRIELGGKIHVTVE